MFRDRMLAYRARFADAQFPPQECGGISMTGVSELFIDLKRLFVCTLPFLPRGFRRGIRVITRFLFSLDAFFRRPHFRRGRHGAVTQIADTGCVLPRCIKRLEQGAIELHSRDRVVGVAQINARGDQVLFSLLMRSTCVLQFALGTDLLLSDFRELRNQRRPRLHSPEYLVQGGNPLVESRNFGSLFSGPLQLAFCLLVLRVKPFVPQQQALMLLFRPRGVLFRCLCSTDQRQQWRGAPPKAVAHMSGSAVHQLAVG